MKIAVLTSGGDSAGMNAVVRAVVRGGILKYIDRQGVTQVLILFFPEVAKLGLSGRDMKALSEAILKHQLSKRLLLYSLIFRRRQMETSTCYIISDLETDSSSEMALETISEAEH